jgi:peroxiredoxin (alkyl hydroperoxide reductase subunit C)
LGIIGELALVHTNHGGITMEAIINKEAPGFTTDAYINDEIEKISLEQYKGKWVVLFFYPADFTFVCPTELGSLADAYSELQKLDVEVLSVSTDTAFVHKAWHDTSETIKKIAFPMIADPTGKISKSYGVYIDTEGITYRGTFLIDPDGILKAFEIHDNSIGRSSVELIRKIKAAQFVKKYGDKVCPANWEPGKDTLKPALNLVGKI